MSTRALLIASAVLLAACGDATGRAGSGGDDDGPDSGVVGGPVPPGDHSGPDPGPSLVVPTPGLVDVHPTRWSEATTRSSGRQLVVHFWGTPCNELDHVDVEPAEDRIVVTVHQGVRPARRGRPCAQLAKFQAVVVDLTEPVAGRRLVDGAAGPAT